MLRKCLGWPLAGMLSLLVVGAVQGQDSPNAGRVRLGQGAKVTPASAKSVVQQVNGSCPTGNCPQSGGGYVTDGGYGGYPGNNVRYGYVGRHQTGFTVHQHNQSGFAKWWSGQSNDYVTRNRCACERWGNRQCGRGCLGGGCLGGCLGGACCLKQWDFGVQKEVIALNPGYSHPADSCTWAAQGYGVPIAVPLAPIVQDQYNYGWGIPSSRLTPIAH